MIDGTVDDKPHTFGPVEPEEFMFALASADATASPPTCLPSKRSALRLVGEIGFNLIAVQRPQGRCRFVNNTLGLIVLRHRKNE